RSCSTSATQPSRRCSRWRSRPAAHAASTSASAARDRPITPSSRAGSSSRASTACRSIRIPSSKRGCTWPKGPESRRGRASSACEREEREAGGRRQRLHVEDPAAGSRGTKEPGNQHTREKEHFHGPSRRTEREPPDEPRGEKAVVESLVRGQHLRR